MFKKIGAVLVSFLTALLGMAPMALPADVETGEFQASVSVNTFLDITIETPMGYGINFGSTDPGANDLNTSNSWYNLTVESITNINTALWNNATDWSCDSGGCGSDGFLVGNMTWNATYNSNTTKADYTTGFAHIRNITCPCGVSANETTVYNWLDVPGGKLGGNYNSTVGIKANSTS
jgi:hypothetical protein